MISEQDIQRCVDFLRDSAPQIAEARAELVRSEHMKKATRALAMKASGENSVAAQEREALASDQYKQAVDAEFEAVKRYETLRAQREAAIAKIDAWRTSSANLRGVDRLG